VVFGLQSTQSNVNEHFRMLVPIYLELADGRTSGTGPLNRKYDVEAKDCAERHKGKTAARSG
jgi:hypothetical protein